MHMNKHRKGLWEATAAGPRGQRGRCGARPERGLRVSKNSAEPQGEGCRRRGAEAEVS